MVFGLYFNDVLQIIPKTVLGWKYIVLFIGCLFSPTKRNVQDFILTGEKVAPILDIVTISIPTL